MEKIALTPKYNKVTLYEDLCSDKVEITLDGYDIIQEGGKWFAVKKKKEYPKTYAECCKVMNYCCNPVATKTTHKEELIRRFQFLLLYRDAYWKIAGEEMGLGKPWEPTNDKYSYIITRCCNEITTYRTAGNSVVLEFPTAEMRDEFYENFKIDIENCKDLL